MFFAEDIIAATSSASELVSASRSKSSCTLKNEDPLIAAEGYVVRQRSTVLREDQKRIPKQVRDDNRRDFQKVMMDTIAFADSENAIICL
jgi:hypothetical protein